MNYEWLYHRSFRYFLSVFILGILILVIDYTSKPELNPELWVRLFFPLNNLIGLGLIVGSLVLGLLNLINNRNQSRKKLSNPNHYSSMHNINLEQLDFVTLFFSTNVQDKQINLIQNSTFSKIKDKFHAFYSFLEKHYIFVRSSFPPLLIIIGGIALDLLTALYAEQGLIYGALQWNIFLNIFVPVFCLPILFFLPLFFLPALQEFTSLWGETYFSFPTRRESYIVGRYYIPIIIFLLISITFPIIINTFLCFSNYHTLFPIIPYPGISPPLILPIPIDQTLFTEFFIISICWFILFFLVFGLIFFYLLLNLRKRSISFGLYFLLVIGYFVFALSFFSNSTFSPLNVVGFLPAVLIFQILPAPNDSSYPAPSMSPLLGLLILIIGILIEFIIIAVLSLLINRRMKYLECNI